MRYINKKALEALEPKAREEYLQKLEWIQEYKKVNPLYFYNHPTMSAKEPHLRQLEFHMMQLKIRAFFGGNQSGKTTGAIADCLIQAVDRDILPPHLIPYKKWDAPFKCRIFTPDLQDTMFVVQDKIRELVPVAQLKGGTWDKAYNKIDRILRFKNGSYFQFMSYEQDIEKLGSATLHRIYYDEEPPKKIFEECQPRLMRYGGDQIFAMTPLQGMSWTYNEIWRESGGEDENYDVWKFENPTAKIGSIIVDMDDNPYLTEENKADTLRTYDATTRKARKEGRFVHFAGLIYSEFNPKDHVIQLVEKPYERNRFMREVGVGKVEKKAVNIVVSIDPGFNHCGVLWGCVDEDNNIIVFDELFKEEFTIKTICHEIKKVNAFHRIEPAFYLIDPHARDRSKQTGRSDQSEFTRYGIYTLLAHNAVEAGISAVKDRLADGKLAIDARCVNLLREFKVYRWKEKKFKGPEEDTKAEPIKKDDHCLDALRYMVMARPYLPDQEEVDNRNWMEKLIDEDIEMAEAGQPARSEFGGVFL